MQPVSIASDAFRHGGKYGGRVPTKRRLMAAGSVKEGRINSM
jgi:hypothetical protein